MTGNAAAFVTSGPTRLGYVHARVIDLAEAKRHYGYPMGLIPALEEPGRIYHKGWDEWDHHSVVLEEGGRSGRSIRRSSRGTSKVSVRRSGRC